MEKVLDKRVAFVTGGSGFVGSRLLIALVKNGWEVRALVRSEAAAAVVQRLGAVPVPGDLGDTAALRQGLSGCVVVFHVAALFKLWGARADFDKVNVEGMRALIEAVRASPSVKRIVAVSAAAVVMGSPAPMLDLDESAPLQQPDFAPYGASKAQAERLLIEANRTRHDLETIAIRPPMIWGAGMPMLEQMAETVKAGQWQWVDHGRQSMSTCHVENLVHVLLLAAQQGQGGQAYFVADSEVGTLKSVLGGLLKTRGVVASDKSVPFGMAWLLAGVMGSVWRLLRLEGEPPITRQMLRLIGKSFTISTVKAQRDLGYVPVMSWNQGIEQMLSQERSAAS